MEVRRGLARARLFNLGGAELDGILARWSGGDVVEIGEREWDPGASILTVLEGPRLDPADLAMGQGWNSAAKVSRDVSAELLERARATRRRRTAVGVLAKAGPERRALDSVLDQLGLSGVEWAAVRASLLDSPEPELDLAAGVILLDDSSTTSLFDVGLVSGALGSRTILVHLGSGPLPAELADLDPIRADHGVDWPQALAERLRQIQD